MTRILSILDKPPKLTVGAESRPPGNGGGLVPLSCSELRRMIGAPCSPCSVCGCSIIDIDVYGRRHCPACSPIDSPALRLVVMTPSGGEAIGIEYSVAESTVASLRRLYDAKTAFGVFYDPFGRSGRLWAYKRDINDGAVTAVLLGVGDEEIVDVYNRPVEW